MMKRISIVIAMLAAMTAAAQDIRVVSNQVVGQGFAPQLSADGMELTYVESEHVALHPQRKGLKGQGNSTEVYATNEELQLVLYQNGERTVLTPRGAEENYVWAEVSPDGTRVLYATRYGTEICDLEGRIVANLGHLNEPQWYGNEYVVGQHETSDGHRYLTSCIAIAKADGTMVQELTAPEEMGMNASVAATHGRVAYTTLDGEMHLMQLNLTEMPISRTLPTLRLAPQMMRKAPTGVKKTTPQQVKIYINPGHGGYTGNDRGITAFPFAAGDTLGFWESSSNLTKGLRLDTMLRALGMQTKLSRTLNREEDDLDLSVIVAQANAWGADFMLSIHTNAGTPSNYILQLYAGRDADDHTIYADMGQASDESRAITTLMGERMYENQVTVFSRVPYITGDKTFARKIMGWSNGYGVLRRLTVPGTISEGEMHDYRPTLYRLMNMDYRYRESFYFAETFMEYFLGETLPYGAVGGMVRDVYRKHEFPDIYYRRGTSDEQRALLGAEVALCTMQGDTLKTYTTDSLFNGCFFFWEVPAGQYVVRTHAEHYYDMADTVEVVNGHIAYANFFQQLQRSTPPTVLAHTPDVALTDSQQVSTDLTIRFSWDMNKEATAAALQISPAVEGTVSWEDDGRLMRFTPATRFEPGTEYTITIGTGACHPDTLFACHLEEAYTYRFRTKNRGSIRFVQSYPVSGATDVPLSPSFITIFDETIVGSTAKAAMKVVDASGKEQAVNTRSFAYNKAPEPYGFASFELVNALQPNSDYELVIGPTVKDKEGILLNQSIRIPFRTAGAVKTDVPVVNALDTLLFEGDMEASTNVQQVYTFRNTTKKVSGQASNQLNYVFTEDQGEAHFKSKNPMLVVQNSLSTLAMQVFSDYSFNTLYAIYATEGDIHYVKVCDLDYAGWRYQQVELSTLPEGVDFQLMGFKLERQDSFLSAAGAFYIDDLSANYVTQTPDGLEELETAAERKRIEDGQVLITSPDGTVYTAAGQAKE